MSLIQVLQAAFPETVMSTGGKLPKMTHSCLTTSGDTLEFGHRAGHTLVSDGNGEVVDINGMTDMTTIGKTNGGGSFVQEVAMGGHS